MSLYNFFVQPSGHERVLAATCGDGVIEETEECDDDNTTSGDGCSSTCTVSVSGWTDKQLITILSSEVSSTESDFPVLLSDSAFLDTVYLNSETDGSDLFFSSDASGTTPLAFEVVDWDTGNEEAEVWVKILSLSSSSDTTIYAWYNNASAIAPDEDADNGKHNVWDSFAGVWHLNETVTDEQTSGTHYDSTSNSNDGTQSGNASTSSGKIGTAQDFDGNDTIVDSSTSNLPTGSVMSASAWIKPTAYPNATWNGILFYGIRSSYDSFGTAVMNTGRLSFFNFNNDLTPSTGGAVTQSEWNFATWVLNGTSITTYINGTEAVSGTLGATPSIPQGSLKIGNTGATSEYFTGSIDEIHVSSSVFTDEWISTSYNNQGDPDHFTEVCGNGYVSGTEACDDGNTTAGDGCSATCTEETGWLCDSSEPSVCHEIICGDSTIEGDEECDDGNTSIGDGCDDFCQISKTGYSLSQSITIYNGKVDEDLSNFPVLLKDNVFGSSSGSIYTNTKSDGSDLLFTSDETGTTFLPFEVVSWIKASGTSEVWVKPSSIANATDTTIYVWYNNSSAIMPSAAASNGKNAVWSNSYAGVWHLNEDVIDEQTTGIHYDSTSYANHSLQRNNVTFTSGKIGKAQDFDGSSDYIDIGTGSEFESANVTLSIWAKFDITGGYRQLMSKRGCCASNDADLQWWFQTANDSKIHAALRSNSNNYETISPFVLTTDWAYYTQTYDGETIGLYINGVLVNSNTSPSGSIHSIPAMPVVLAARANGTSSPYSGRADYYDGKLDEARLSGAARSDGWISTEYNNQNAPSAFAGFCGNGVIGGGETCDDGNLTTGDGCDDSCQISSTGYTESQTITILSSEVSSTESNFPVLLNDSAFLSNVYDNTETDGSDLLFTDSAGTTFYAFEVVDWDTTSDEAEVWVNIPSLSSSSDTDIKVWYNNASAVAPHEDADNGKHAVWDSNYMAVYHLGEDVTDEGSSSDAHSDSTSNDNDADQSGNAEIAGQIGYGQYFDGGNDNIILTESPTTGTGSFSISSWVNTTSTGTRKQLVTYGTTTTNQGAWFFIDTDNKVQLDLSNTGGPSSDLTVTDGEWHYVNAVNNAGSIQIYVDGSASGSPASMSPNIASGSAYLGRGLPSYTWYMNGSIDETRISDTNRSSGWIATEYNNQSDPDHFTQICGNGFVSGTEECDDGNTSTGDGCDDICAVETDWLCDSSEPSVCVEQICGNSIISGTEQCDDGNTADNDGCSSSCQIDKTGYTESQTITILSSEVSSTESNFPVLLNDSAFLSNVYDNTETDGSDLLFTDSAGTTFYAFEVVDWDTTSDEAEVWVNIPSLSSSSDTTLKVWYNNSSAIAPGAEADNGSEAVWSDYVGVWHLDETVTDDTTGGTHYDSTENDNDGDQYYSGTVTDAKIGQGQAFDGSGDYISIADTNGTLDMSGDPFSVSMWARRSGLSGAWARYFVKEIAGNVNPYVSYSIHQLNTTNDLNFSIAPGGSGSLEELSTDDDAPFNEWYKITVVYNGTNQYIYINDSLNNSREMNVDNNITTTNTPLVFGGDTEINSEWYSGYLDEIRFYDGELTVGWIETEYNNQSDPDHFTEVCGNGYVSGTETCDDGNFTTGDGCDDSCAVESQKWECVGEPSVCTYSSLCGDAEIDLDEECDDGDTDNGDGCSSLCIIEFGYYCTGEPSQCYVAEGTRTAKFTFYNAPPSFDTVPAETTAVTSSAPVDEGGSIVWNATATDQGSEDYYLVICADNTGVTVGAPPACDGTELAVSSVTASGSQAIAAIADTTGYSNEEYVWYAYACDASGCSSASQGTGDSGSPFYVNHAPSFTTVAIGNATGGTGAIEPGDTIYINVDVADSDTSGTQDTVDMYVCATAGFSAGACTGTEICHVIGVDPSGNAECDDSGALAPIPTAHGSADLYVYIQDSHSVEGSGTNTQSYSVEDVAPMWVSYGSIVSPINLTAGATTDVSFTAVISDNNGEGDVDSVEGYFYDDTAIDLAGGVCTEDHNDCYKQAFCTLNTAYGTNLQAEAQCSISVYFNANASSGWKGHVNPIDGLGKVTSFGDTDAAEINPISALSLAESLIDYGVLTLGQISSGVSVSVGNAGNQIIDATVHGTDMCSDWDGCSEYTIAREQQRWNISGGSDFDWLDAGHAILSSSGAGDPDTNGCADMDLAVRDNATQTIYNQAMYWKIRVPEAQENASYTGEITISEISGSSCTGNP